MFDLKKAVFTDLKEDWEELFKAFGVDSLEALQKGGVKDKTKLIAVKKQITRNGKSVMTTVYVSPEEAKTMKKPKKVEPEKKERSKKKEEPKKERPKKEEEGPKGKHTTEIHSPFDVSGDKVKAEVEKWKDTEANKALKEVANHSYLVSAKDASGTVIGVGAFERKNGNLVMTHFGSSGTVKGSGKSVVQHLIEKAKAVNLGVQIHPPKGSSALLTSLGFEDNLDGTMTLSKEAVSKYEEKKEETTGKPTEEGTSKEKPEKDSPEKEKKDPVKAELRQIRKTIGSGVYRDMLKANGITWEPSDHSGVETMRASMAAAAFIKAGGKLDLEAHDKEEVKTEQKKAAEKEEKEAKKALDESHTSEIVRTPKVKVSFGLSPQGNKMLFINGVPRSIRDIDEFNMKAIEKLTKATDAKQVIRVQKALEKSGKGQHTANALIKTVLRSFEVRDSLYKDEKHNIALGNIDAEALGNKLNSVSNSDIPEETRDDILTYTGSMYTAINRYHRYGDTSPNEQITGITERLNTLIKGNTIKEDVMLYRGAGKATFGDDMYEDMLKNPDKYIGAEIEDKGFMSTSVNPEVSFDGELKFEIKTPKGTNALFLGNDLSGVPWESEVLFPTDTKLKIVGVEKKLGKLHIIAEVI